MEDFSKWLEEFYQNNFLETNVWIRGIYNDEEEYFEKQDKIIA